MSLHIDHTNAPNLLRLYVLLGAFWRARPRCNLLGNTQKAREEQAQQPVANKGIPFIVNSIQLTPSGGRCALRRWLRKAQTRLPNAPSDLLVGAALGKVAAAS